MKPEILIIHSNSSIRKKTSLYLKQNGYAVDEAGSINECRNKLVNNPKFKLILLELEFNKDNTGGIKLAHEISANYSLPLVFATGRRDEHILRDTESISHYGIIRNADLQSQISISTIQTALRLHQAEYSHKVSEEKYRFFFESIPIAAIVSDDSYTIQEWNHAATQLFGYKREDVLGRKLIETLYSEKNDKSARQLSDFLCENLENRTTSHNYNYDRTKDGRDILCEWYDLSYLRNGHTYILSVAKDITEEQQLIEELRDTVIEKEFLLKETHHRVKNSLNMITSLINLKTGNLEEQEAFADLKSKIKALSSLYEKLHQTTEVNQVDLQQYAEELLNSLFSTFSELPVKIFVEMNQISTDPDTAIAIGLIINEIATNAIKHGFIPEQRNWFEITLQTENQGSLFILRISNSGNPLPRSLDLSSTKTLGLRLIQTLVNQLNGSIEITREPQPVYTIRFPRKNSL